MQISVFSFSGLRRRYRWCVQNEKEKAIGSRIRQFRELLQISRSQFAVSIGFGSERIASYEAARSPLPYAVFLAISRRYRLNPHWLMTGTGKPQLPQPFPDWRAPGSIAPRALFSELFQSIVSGHNKDFDEYWSGVALNAFHEFLAYAQDFASPLDARRALIEKADAEIENAKAKLAKDAILIGENKKSLTSVDVSVNPPDVQPQWPLLKKRLRQSAADITAKSKLAKFIGVKLASVNQWLRESDEAREPGAETALRMLRWVELQERK